jgi:PST family polysaccharide transporter
VSALRLRFDSPATRNFAWLASDKAFATVFGILVFGLIARRYGPEGSGHYAFAVTLLQTALGLSLVCSAGALLPRITRMRKGIAAGIANIFVVRLAGSVLATAAVAIYAIVTITDHTRLLVSLLLLCAAPLMEPFYVATMYWVSRNRNRVPVVNRSIGLATRAAVVGAAIALEAPLWMPAMAWLVEALLVARLHVGSLSALGGWRAMVTHVSPARATSYFRYGVRFLVGLALAHLYLRSDRLVLAQLLPAHEFGIYATAMQLVEVWLQVSQIIGASIGPAFLYAALARKPHVTAHWRTIAILAGIGLGGLSAVLLLGRPALALIFGSRFLDSYPFLVAGTAFATLVFIDQVVQTSVTVARRPGAFAFCWATRVVAAVASEYALFGSLGAFAGPAGLAIGTVTGWVALVGLRLFGRGGSVR